jgi:hypothetical protein
MNFTMSLKDIGCEAVDWIHLVQDTVQWRALVNMVMNLSLRKRWGLFWPTEWLLASQEWFRSIGYKNSARLWVTLPSRRAGDLFSKNSSQKVPTICKLVSVILTSVAESRDRWTDRHTQLDNTRMYQRKRTLPAEFEKGGYLLIPGAPFIA